MSDYFRQLQVSRCCSCGLLVMVLLASGFSLSACGKKAGTVDPPLSVQDDTFPRTYPDPSTDPKATYKSTPSDDMN